MRAVYVGLLAHLKGKTALLRFPPEEGHVVAQFDDCSLTRSGQPIPSPCDTLPVDALGFGWHVFRREEFDVTP